MLSSVGKTIGIISGSGPEAGLDLHAKLLRAQRAALGERYRGDTDAPRVVTVSEPVLGLSMQLPDHEETVWSALLATAVQLAPQVDVYAIACNTLNVFENRLHDAELGAQLVTVTDVTRGFVRSRGLTRVGLLGAAPVTDLGEWSAYRPLLETVDLVTPDDPAPLHRLIHDIKRRGHGGAELEARFLPIVEALDVDPVLLACTELPLLDTAALPVEAVDVTDLLAQYLVRVAG